jgi:hypothetical protein
MNMVAAAAVAPSPSPARAPSLLVTAGVGRVQIEGGPVEEIRPGDVDELPPRYGHRRSEKRGARTSSAGWPAMASSG